jgi:aminopeptidase N
MVKRLIPSAFTILFTVLGVLPQFVHGQAPQRSFNRTREFDAQNYRIQAEFDRKRKEVKASTTVHVRPLRNGYATMVLDAEGLNVSRVTNDTGQPLRFVLRPGAISISLGRRYSAGSDVKVTIQYTARPRKGVYFVPELSGSGFTRSAQIWTQGEPEEARHWFPSYDFPDDKATTEQILTVDGDETVIANGRLVEERRNPDGTKTFHHRMDVPHSTYLVSFVIGKFVKEERLYRDIPLGFYTYPHRPDAGRSVFLKTESMMRVFEDLTGIPYPFNKYDQTVVANFSFGGMENITATTLSDRDVALADSPLGAPMVEDLVAHELAHSWFGNLVTCRNWAELWLNEGFATFMEAAYRERVYGRDDYLKKIRQDAADYLFDDARRVRKHGLFNLLAKPDDSIFDAVAYKKGSAVVHMLRETVGEDAFWKGIGLYLRRHSLGNTETPDLRKAFEETSGADLNWFFRQWVYGTGHPELRVAAVYSKAQRKVTVRVSQEHRTGGLTPASFRIPLEIAFTSSGGVTVHRALITRPIETFVFEQLDEPKSMELDPALRVPLKAVKGTSLLIR